MFLSTFAPDRLPRCIFVDINELDKTGKARIVTVGNILILTCISKTSLKEWSVTSPWQWICVPQTDACTRKFSKNQNVDWISKFIGCKLFTPYKGFWVLKGSSRRNSCVGGWLDWGGASGLRLGKEALFMPKFAKPFYPYLFKFCPYLCSSILTSPHDKSLTVLIAFILRNSLWRFSLYKFNQSL